MPVKKALFLCALIGSAAPGVSKAEDLMKALRKRFGPDPLVTICASSPCRKDVKISLKKDDGTNFSKTLRLGPPVVYNGVATVFPGETIRIEATPRPDGLIEVTAVSQIEHPERTITVHFEQVSKPDSKPSMALTVSNPFGTALALTVLLNQGEAQAIAAAVTCPVPKQAWTTQEWPGLVTEVVMTQFRLLPEGDQPAC